MGSNTTSTSKGTNVFQPEQFSSRLCFDQYSHGQYKTSATNALQNQQQNRYIKRDKDDRKTADKVLDKRTAMIIHKYINNEDISGVYGCISTGKEANVYYCASEKYGPCALKIYKTSTMVFKDRDKYVTGDYKFRHGYAKHNSRKKILVWAEKEFSNLHKLYSAGLRVPEPLKLRSHLLLMRFLGHEQDPAPLLKDLKMSSKVATELYWSLVLDMWTMYRVCRLVHADLSEFNLLVNDGQIFIIDVSQSVTPEHPHAIDFLKKDCFNITEFFRKKGAQTVGFKDLFLFIVDKSISHENKDECFVKLKQKAAARDPNLTNEEKVDEEVFKGAFIPQNLGQVVDFERDYYEMKMGQRHSDDLDYQPIIGMAPDLSSAATVPRILHGPESHTNDALCSASSQSSADVGADNDCPINCDANDKIDAPQYVQSPIEREVGEVKLQLYSNEENEVEDVTIEEEFKENNCSSKLKHQVRPKGETTEEKKLRKKEVKEDKAEKRKTKVPKHVKKRATKK
ncbi:hypothetical protein HAZT_HAZT006679 [Hyalella azteca]|nr:hypothetical protein HAZT_HAZT006679 [Hyalella azteca]